MTISSLTNRISYPGAGSVGPYTFPFRIFASADLRVIKRSTLGVDTVLTETTDYTVSGVGNATGSVTLTTALAADETLVIRRAPANTQPTSVQNQGSYFAKTHEDEFDRLVMQVQALQDQVDRGFGISEFYNPSAYTLRMKPETGKVIGWLSSTQLGSFTLDSGAIAIPGGGRTVATLTAYLANNAVFNVKDYGAVGDGDENFGGTDDTAAIQAAYDDAASAGGGAVYFPVGRYRTSAAIDVAGDDITSLGDGAGSEIIGYDGAFLTATSRSKLQFRNLKFTNCRGVLSFTTCTDLEFVDCYFDGVYGGNPYGQQHAPDFPDPEDKRLLPSDPDYTLQVTPQGIITGGCKRVHVTGCTFKDYNDAIYLAASAGTPTSEILVDRSFFFHDNHAQLAIGSATPTGVYLLDTDNATVANCFFKNICPGGSGDGYGVYEGDGSATKISIIGCHFTLDDFTSGTFHGILISQARSCLVNGCIFSTSSTFEAFVYGAVNQVIANCIFDNTHVTLAPTTGVAAYVSLVVSGNEFRGATGVPLLISSAAPGYNEALVIGNHFYNASKGAIRAANCTFAAIIGNYIINCNQSADHDDSNRGGINFYGCIDGLVDGNVIMNSAAEGLMDYGVAISAADHHVQITRNNRIRNMVNGSVLRPLTAPPISGIWDRGTEIPAWDATSGSPMGWVCTVSGTPGTWKAQANLA